MSVQQYSQRVIRPPFVPEISRESVLAVFFTLLMITSVLALTASPALLSSSGASEQIETGDAAGSGSQVGPSASGPSGGQIGAGAAAITGGLAVSSEPASAAGGLPVEEGFDGSKPSEWSTLFESGSGDPAEWDADEGGRSGTLRLTEASGDQAGSAIYQKEFSSDNGITAEFDYYSAEGNGADGFTFFLLNSSQASGFSESDLGESGGALGYEANPGSDSGIKAGYLGVGFDEYGNFADGNVGSGSIGCSDGAGGRHSQSVTIRGAGDAVSGCEDYNWLTTEGALHNNIDGGWRRVRLTVDPTQGDANETGITVEMNWLDGTGWHSILDGSREEGQFTDAEIGRTRPSNYYLGFSGSTGGLDNIHAIDDLTVKQPADLETTVTSDPSNGPYN